MQTGLVKVSTIYRFKGSELAHIFVLFDKGNVELLYTAITLAQDRLSRYVSDNGYYALERVSSPQGARTT